MKIPLIGIFVIYCLILITLYFGTSRGFGMSNPLSTKDNSKKELTAEENILFFFVCGVLLTDFTFRAIGVY
jgi:hypothetical protein